MNIKNTLLSTPLLLATISQSSYGTNGQDNKDNTSFLARKSVLNIAASYYMDETSNFDNKYDLKLQTAKLSIAYWDKDYSKVSTHTQPNNGYIALGGIELSSTHLDLSSHPLLNENEEYHQLRTSLNLGYKFNPKWQIDGYLGLAFNVVDGLDNTHIQGELEAGFLFRFAPDGAFDKGYIFHFGAEQSYDLDGVSLTLASEYKHQNYSIIIGLPKTAVRYQMSDKIALSLGADLQGKRGFFYNEPAANEKVEFQSTAIHTQLLAEYKSHDSLYLQAGVGYLFARQVDIESKTIKINDSTSDGWTLFAGLTYEW